MTKTRIKIREEFAYKGLSYTAWAKKHGYSANMVIEIVNDNDINPRRKCLRGECHNIAVALGLKEGEVYRQPIAA